MGRLLIVLTLLVVGCAPRLAPTYRDYVASAEAPADRTATVREAATEAGWTVTESGVRSVVSTAPMRISTGVFSRVDASLDLAPLDGRYVRVYVHAVRRSVFGTRSKLPALSRSLRDRALGDLTRALAARGLTALDAPRDRDEEATD